MSNICLDFEITVNNSKKSKNGKPKIIVYDQVTRKNSKSVTATSSICFTKKTTFHFLSVGSRVFCEAATERIIQNGTDPFFSQGGHHFTDDRPKLCIFELSRIFGILNGFMPIQLKPG